jgi:hypothetical protein
VIDNHLTNSFPTMFGLCSNVNMTDSTPSATSLSLKGTIFDFTPVPMERQRHNGWTEVAQRRFIAALSAMGSVGAACRAVGMGRVSAYRLRERAGAESFAAAWDHAVHSGRSRQYDVAMERALNGVTTVRVLRGGSVSVSAGPDMDLIHAALRDIPSPPKIAR